MKRLLFVPVALAAAFFYQPSEAQAGVEACGNIYIEAGAQCEVVPPGLECETECVPVNVEVQCAAELYVECSAMCNASASVDCTGSCTAGCEAECNVDPGSFECATYCSAECSAGCEAQCSDSQCQASCEANCSASCDTECEVVPASADCSASCEASCEGQCTAEANVDCQGSCQSDGFVDCTTEVTGGCVTDCQAEEGALFCDGQYVDVNGNLDECVAALRDLFDIEVEGYADASCEGNSCSAEAGGSIGCAVGHSGSDGTLGVLLIGLGMVAGARRRRRSGQD